MMKTYLRENSDNRVCKIDRPDTKTQLLIIQQFDRINPILTFLPGVLSHKAVREKIVRAFLIEEQKIVAKVLKNQGK